LIVAGGGEGVSLFDTQHGDPVSLSKGVEPVSAVPGRGGGLFFHAPGLWVVQDVRGATALEEGVVGHYRRRGARGVGYKCRAGARATALPEELGDDAHAGDNHHNQQRDNSQDDANPPSTARRRAGATWGRAPATLARQSCGVFFAGRRPPG